MEPINLTCQNGEKKKHETATSHHPRSLRFARTCFARFPAMMNMGVDTGQRGPAVQRYPPQAVKRRVMNMTGAVSLCHHIARGSFEKRNEVKEMQGLLLSSTPWGFSNAASPWPPLTPRLVCGALSKQRASWPT